MAVRLGMLFLGGHFLGQHLGSKLLVPAPCVAALATMWPQGQKRRRLMGKTSPPLELQTPVVELEDFEKMEDPNARVCAYLVTFPHPRAATSADGFPLRAPEGLSRQQLLDALLESCAHPEYRDAKSKQKGCKVEPDRVGIFFERHAEDAQGQIHLHAHATMAALTGFRFLPVKRALLCRHGLASHWSPHEGYWTAVRYVFWPSAKKPLSSLDKHYLLWADGRPHAPLEDCCHEPNTAPALRKRRLHAERSAAEAGSKEPRMSDMDLYALIVTKGFRNTADDRSAHKQLAAYAKNHCSKVVYEYCFKNRGRLPALIDDVWRWESIDSSLAFERLSRVETLCQAATRQCQCAGQWTFSVTQSFIANKIDVKSLCKDVMLLLKNGRRPDSPVLVLAGSSGGEGKSLFLKALLTVFGDAQVFETPVRGNFPLLGLMESKVCFFDDYRFNMDVLPFSVQCLLFDGSNVPVNRPQNDKFQTGHDKYKGTSPIFVTTKLSDIEMLAKYAAIDPQTGRPSDADASMIYRRLKVYPFTTRIPQPPAGMPYCARCFAELVLQQSQGA